jgi:tetratricopeptide (TPR) repeat protein
VAVLAWGGATASGSLTRPRLDRDEELFYYPSGRFLREAVLGYDQAAASMAWLRVVQYYGKHARSDRQFEMMYRLCDIVTDLDPNFVEPYIFGSFVILSEGANPQQGWDLIQKGLDLCPGSWRIQFEAGFICYVMLEDYERAARYFKVSSGLPGAPDYIDRFAAFVSERAGELEAALVLWAEVARQSENPEHQAKALRKVEQIQARIAERDAAGDVR